MNITSRKLRVVALATLTGTVLSGCLSGGGSEEPAVEPPAPVTPPAATNKPPSISGVAAATTAVGEAYAFAPTASDPDGDVLTFSAGNLPGWLSFDSATGALTGIPGDADVGFYGNIQITVSDGELQASLPAFAVEVVASDNGSEEPAGEEPPAPDTPPAATNNAPTISGVAAATVAVGETYSFAPTATDADGDALTFSAANLPAWTSFDSATGALTGVPGDADVGIYDNIEITVSDGELQASLAAFAVEVVATGQHSITLSWTPPTQNTDGTALTNLAGYNIYYGVTQGEYPNQIRIDNPGVASWVIEGLTPNTYYFVATSVNSDGVESEYSNVAVRIIG